MNQELKEEAIAIIQAARMLSGGDSQLFKYNLEYYIQNSNFARQVITQAIKNAQLFL